jgi:8-amino-7-oxononanoate synthase
VRAEATAMIDFTSSLYLGIRHPRGSLSPWPQLTSGTPSAVDEPLAAKSVAHRLAGLQGCEWSTLGRSTLHLFWDLFGLFSSESVAIYLDAGAYPIVRWGVERAKGRGLPVYLFPHHDADRLRRMLQQGSSRRRPVIVCDGLCTACGCQTPIAAYLECARDHGGLLVVDDTQALGVLGADPDARAPYGRGGGGSLRREHTAGPDVVLVSSLAKGFGAPLAALAGSREMIRQFEARSETRQHCSPPTFADIHAAARALRLNQAIGDRLRLRLAWLVQDFRKRLSALGLEATGALFPVQTLEAVPGLDTTALYEQLRDAGVKTVLRQACRSREPRISFIITAGHRLEDTGQGEDNATWRGKITHVLGGEQRYIRDLNGIISFIVPYLEIMGVKVSDDYRLIHWLKQISDRFR